MSWRYRRRYDDWGGFAPYVTKAEREDRARKAKAKLLQQGADIEPVVLAGRTIARTWWGKAWTENLERYADYGNRLPRGRSYVRHGSILDLKIAAGAVTAIVAGSRPNPYRVAIRIRPLDPRVEQDLLAQSRAALDSMPALLSGEFPAELKAAFLKEGTGLFPSPREIEFSCSCPDWASMCKHVAAALYGTAARLDEKPELFFVLRGVKMDAFVGRLVRRESAKLLRKAKSASARVIRSADRDLSKLFDIALDEAPKRGRTARAPRAPRPRAAGAPERKAESA